MRRIIVSFVVAVAAIGIAHVPNADGMPRAERSAKCANQKTVLKKAKTKSAKQRARRALKKCQHKKGLKKNGRPRKCAKQKTVLKKAKTRRAKQRARRALKKCQHNGQKKNRPPTSGQQKEKLTALGWRAVGEPPLSDAAAAAAVVHRAEVRPDNAGPNSYRPTDAELAAFHSAPDSADNRSLRYVTGRPGLQSPSTDDLIQWAAYKWGIATDWVRADAVDESYWRQSAVNSSGMRGLMQIQATAKNGTEPLRWESTAFNLDFYGATIRFYFDGYCSWCGPNYSAGHEWDSIGAWYEPSPWRNQGAQDYVSRVQAELVNRRWEQPGF